RAFAHVVAAPLEDLVPALGTGPQRLLGREVDHLAGFRRVVFLAEVELQLPVLLFLVVRQREFGRERPARLGAEALQRPDALVTQEGFDLFELEGAARRDLGEGEAARLLAFLADAVVATIGLL